MEQLKKLFAEKINPYLHTHNGEAEVVDVNGDTLIIRMKGACSGCMSVYSTVDDFITTVVQQERPEIKRVMLSDEPDPELWEMARKILEHKISL